MVRGPVDVLSLVFDLLLWVKDALELVSSAPDTPRNAEHLRRQRRSRDPRNGQRSGEFESGNKLFRVL